MNKWLFVFAIGLVLAACSDDDNPATSASGTVVTFSLTCNTSTNCADNSANGRVGAIVILADGITCATFMGQDAEMAGYAALNVTCASGTCSATGNSTILNPATDVATTVSAGTYSYYGFIDTNNDEQPTTGEPASCTDANTFDGSTLSFTVTGNQ